MLLSIISVELVFRMKTYFSRSDNTSYIVDFHELVSNTEVGKKTKDIGLFLSILDLEPLVHRSSEALV